MSTLSRNPRLYSCFIALLSLSMLRGLWRIKFDGDHKLQVPGNHDSNEIKNNENDVYKDIDRSMILVTTTSL